MSGSDGMSPYKAKVEVSGPYSPTKEEAWFYRAGKVIGAAL